MKRRVATSLLGLAIMAGLAAPASAAEGVKVGMLTCNVQGGMGYIVASSKALECVFKSNHTRRSDRYVGSITKIGADIGITTGSHIMWAVFAPGKLKHGSLSGSYFGATGEATLGVGLGANVLVGGFKNSVNLQPLSLQVQTGVNVAGGIASLSLHSQ